MFEDGKTFKYSWGARCIEGVIKNKLQPGATWEAEIKRIKVRGQPRHKVPVSPSQPIKDGRGGTCLLSQPCRKCK
jgi:hypothetical protein